MNKQTENTQWKASRRVGVCVQMSVASCPYCSEAGGQVGTLALQRPGEGDSVTW